MSPHVVEVGEVDRFPDRIDTRSPAEFTEDHLPGAVSHPVLDDAERARVGTLHKEAGAFEAKKVGAALVARRIADLLERHFAGRPREWRPLVYCWRGGKRSGALVHVMNEIGWRAVQLAGGYKAWRRQVVAELARLPDARRFVVVCGLTGTGKSRLLGALARAGAQVLDLEGLARHRGSLLGDLPAAPQPSQKAFETALYEALRALDAGRPVYVESESRRIGTLQVPEALLATIRASPCLRLELAPAQRVRLLKDEYPHFLSDPRALADRLAHLAPLHGRATVERWARAALCGEIDALVGELLERHYDPTYLRSMRRNYAAYDEAPPFRPDAAAEDAYDDLAGEVLRRFEPAVEARR